MCAIIYPNLMYMDLLKTINNEQAFQRFFFPPLTKKKWFFSSQGNFQYHYAINFQILENGNKILNTLTIGIRLNSYFCFLRS